MFMNDVHKKEEIRTIATQQLRTYGIKYRSKKSRHLQVNSSKYGKKFFKVPLQHLDTRTVTLKDGRQLIIPKLVHEMCSFILTKVTTEGIFRKEGSKSRQNEIKLSLDRGCMLGDDHHEIDVAVVLKCFLRELPEPLIPSTYHELFLRCSIIERKVEAILLSCLLLPTEHLNVLSYLMQFFNEVASYSESNKMNINNLSILLGPNIFPIDEKVAPKSQHALTKTCDIIKIMLENCKNIGVIPDHIIEQIGNLSASEADLVDKRKKKRRSGSLTRMFNGLRKIVGSNKGDETPPQIVAPDLLITPSINRSVKKRKTETNGLSVKKKKDVLNHLPDAMLLNTPFTPHRTPVSVNPNPKISQIPANVNGELVKEKKHQWYMRSRSVKSLKDDDDFVTRRHSLGPKGILERRWSAVSQAANFRKKKQHLLTKREVINDTPDSDNVNKINTEPEYVKVSKEEYEEIKNRVSAIEKTISKEFDNVQSHVSNTDNEKSSTKKANNIINVQTAYEKTLVQTEPLSPTTDQLARRLSKELRIRRTSEQKVIRSPSARKIGSMRRRSRELEKQTAKLSRTQSWHVASTTFIPRASLKRGKLPIQQPSPDVVPQIEPIDSEAYNKRVTRSSSFQDNFQQLTINNSLGLSNTQKSFNTSSNASVQWTSADGFFSAMQTPKSTNVSNNGRPSIAKLRSQNAGMVLAKAKLFDNLQDSDNSSSSKSQENKKPPIARKCTTGKIGSTRNNDVRMSYRIRSLKAEEKRLGKKSMSPRRRNGNLSQRQRLYVAKQYVDMKLKEMETVNKENSVDSGSNAMSPRRTPRNVPNIKKSIVVKSPKRLCRTPQKTERNTPLKVLATPVLKL